jgi:hypothetical protein
MLWRNAEKACCHAHPSLPITFEHYLSALNNTAAYQEATAVASARIHTGQ